LFVILFHGPSFSIQNSSAGGLDRLCPPQDARRLAELARGPVEFLLVEDGNHVAHNRFYKYRARSADWMAQQLGAARS